MPRQATAAPGLDAATNPSAASPLSPRAAPQADAAAAAASQSMRVTPYAATGVDSSSPEAFIRSIAPYAQRVSQATGIPAEALRTGQIVDVVEIRYVALVLSPLNGDA